jgi:curli biogenesis system outer membrane secretion channel CsgG
MRITISAMLVAACSMVSGPLQAQVTDMKEGEGGSTVQGGAGTTGTVGDTGDLARCDKPMGAVAVVEPQDYISQALSSYGLGSPTGLIRLMIQQSNCFIVVERGTGMQNMMQERSLGDSGELREGSNMGGGQMVSADFILTPAVVFSEDNAGGLGGAVGGLLGSKNRYLGGVAGGLKFKEAQTSMLLADSRSGVQVAAAEGSAKKADFALGSLLGAGGVGVAGGGYSKTNEGKVIAASLADNYNGIVAAVRNDPALQRDVGTLAEEAAKKTAGGAVFNEGDVVRPKIGNVKLMAEPSGGAEVVATLGRGEELVYMGIEQDGYLSVESGAGGGWVRKALVSY